jgi:DNA-binding GntR family transcriptional regulator
VGRRATSKPEADLVDVAGSLGDEDATLGDRVYRALSTALRMGRLAPGQVLTIRAVAAAFKISRMPVREALLKLTAQGALEVLDSGSVRMPTLSGARYFELTQARIMIESQAAAEAAAHATPADVRAARDLNARYERARQAGELEAVLASNYEFHFHVYRVSRNDTLLRMIEVLWMQAGPYVAKTLGIDALVRRQRASQPQPNHRQMVEALAAGDQARAREALAKDIRDGFAAFESFERSLGPSLSGLFGEAGVGPRTLRASSTAGTATPRRRARSG